MPPVEGGAAVSLVEVIWVIVNWAFGQLQFPPLSQVPVALPPHAQLLPAVCGVHALRTQLPVVGSKVCPGGHDGETHVLPWQHWPLMSVYPG